MNALDNFRYVPFAAGTAHGSLMEAVAAEAPDIVNFDIYAAGSWGFVDAARRHCESAGLPADQWKSEVVA